MDKSYLLVGAGGAIGAMLRFGMNNLAVFLRVPSQINTFVINILGSFLMGLLVASCNSSDWKLFATIGLCGGFTTFSTFSMQSVSLLQEGRYGIGALYIFGSAVMCVCSALFGYFLGRRI